MNGNGLASLVQHARLHIHEFNVHELFGLSQRNRRLLHHGMSYLQEGTATVRMDGKEWVMRPGSVALFPAGVLHDHIAPPHVHCVFLWWNYEFRIADTVDLMRFFPMPTVFDMPQTDVFEASFRQYVSLAETSEQPASLVMRQAKALEVMAIILDAAMRYQSESIRSESIRSESTRQASGILPHMTPQESSRPSATITEPFLGILGELLEDAGEDLSLTALSRRYNLNPTYISNRFRMLFGITPDRLHRCMVLDRAAARLQHSGMSIREVAELSGYADEAAFSKAFQRQHGIPPGRLRSGG